MSYKQVVVEGKGGISARIVLDSVSAVTGSRITTFELVYHRNIHAELMTHRVFSRNAASSRAIPFTKMKEQCTAMPIFYGKNQSGMQAKEELDGNAKQASELAITNMRDSVLNGVSILVNLGNHKQTYNRYLEPYQMMKTIVTATSFDNWFWLRKDGAADPLIEELAKCMYEAFKQSGPQVLQAGEWHLPFVETLKSKDGGETFYYLSESHIGTTGHVSLEDALKVSAARSAAVSFRNNDYGLEKSREVWERLVGDERKHSSAMEHQAKVMQPAYFEYGEPPINCLHTDCWEDGISHSDREGNLWSGNLKNFIQLRKLIDGECCHNYEEAVTK